jgi:hypothetical protein
MSTRTGATAIVVRKSPQQKDIYLQGCMENPSLFLPNLNNLKENGGFGYGTEFDI